MYAESTLSSGLGAQLAVEGDFIGECFSYFSNSEDERSPEVYRLWSAIGMLSSSLERRVKIMTGRWSTFPNLFIMLVGEPGVGKGIISSAESMLRATTARESKTPAFWLAPTNSTKASLVDSLEKSTRTINLPDGTTYTSAPLMQCIEEFGALMGKHDMELISLFNILYNAAEVYEERRRVGDRHVLVENPILNFLGGVQPAILGSLFPEEHWTSGLARRMMMVFSDEDRLIDPFGARKVGRITREHIVGKLSFFSSLVGEVVWGQEAAELFVDWHMGGQKPKPTHSKLGGYTRERSRNICRLAGLSVISRTQGITTPIQPIDFRRALDWMLSIEVRMPDVFRAMTGKSDYGLVEELWLFVSRKFVLSKGAGVTDGELATFVGERTTYEKVDKIIELAERMNKIRRKPLGTSWEPTGKAEHLPE